MLKKFLAPILSLALLSALILGCSSPTPTQAPTTAAPAPITTQAPLPPAPVPPAPVSPVPATSSPKPAPAKVYNWKMFSIQTPKDWNYLQMPQLGKNIEAATNGAVKIQFFASGEHPYKAADMLKVVRDRSAEIIDIQVGMASGVEPLIGIYALPFVMPPKFEDVVKLHSATVNDIMGPLFDRWNSKELMAMFWPPQNYHANVPVTSWDSLKGQRIRGYSAELLQVTNMMNGIGVNIEWAQVATSLATKVIDGLITSNGSAYDAGFYQHVKYNTIFGISVTNSYYLINKSALAELDPATRDAFVKAWTDFEPYMMQGNMVDAWKKTEMLATDYGATIVAPSTSFRNEVRAKAVAEIYPDWIKRAGTEGEKALALLQKKYAELVK